MKILCSLWNQFRVRDEIIYCTGKEVEDPWRLVIHRDKHSEILMILDDNKCAGHPGISRMKIMVGTRFYWPRMRQGIANWIKWCRSCTMAKLGPKWSRHPLQLLSGALFDRVSFDVIGSQSQMDAGNRFILTVIDYYSKWALPNHRAETVADCIVSQWIAHHVITQLKQMISVKETFRAPYRPQSNGLCECMNQMIENIIKCTMRENGKMWYFSLPLLWWQIELLLSPLLDSH